MPRMMQRKIQNREKMEKTDGDVVRLEDDFFAGLVAIALDGEDSNQFFKNVSIFDKHQTYAREIHVSNC